MEYQDINEIKEDWSNGQFNYPKEIMVDEMPFHIRADDKSQSFTDIIMNGSKGYIIYTANQADRKEIREKGLKQWILFIWETVTGSIVRPFDVRSVSPQAFNGMGVKATEVQEGAQERIGDVVIVKIKIPSGQAVLKGKVDTGADMSSLHADEMKVVGGMVKFSNKQLSNGVITMPMKDKQSVSSADGGIEYRPVIELDIEINGKPISNALFNLNDRSEMKLPMLIGNNVLEKTNFLIDPQMNDQRNEDVESEEEWLAEDAEIDYALLEEYITNIINEEE